MAGGGAQGGEIRSETYKEARVWLLMPAWLTLSVMVLVPVSLMLILSLIHI